MRNRVVSALLVVLALPAAADNLLTNPDFNTNTNGWTFVGTGTVGVDPGDANGSSTSNSAGITHTGPGGTPAVFSGIGQCVPVSVSKKYTVAFASVASGQNPSAGSPGARVEFFGGGGCSGTRNGVEVVTTSFTATFTTTVATSLPTTFSLPAGTVSARVSFGLFKTAASGSLAATFDALHFGETDLASVVVPASASVAGANGTFFRTALWGVNLSPNRVAPVGLAFRCLAGAGCDRSGSTLTIGPGGLAYSADVVAAYGTAGNGGALEFTYDRGYAPFSAVTRTYSPSLDGPSTGSTLAALPSSEARTSSILLALAGSPDPSTGFRTNVGVYNPGPTDATATITVRNSQRLTLGSPIVVTAPSRRPVQINDLVARAGATLSEEDLALVAYVDSTVPVFSYATVIDNRSADSMIVTGAAFSSTTSPNLLTNGGFQADTSDWVLNGPGELRWDPEGVENPGSAVVTNTNPSANTTTFASQCVPIVPNQPYSMALSARKPPGQSGDPTNQVIVGLDFFQSPGCSGSNQANTVVVTASSTNSFFRTAIPSYFSMPSGLASLLVRVGATKKNAGGSLEVRWDSLVLAPAAPQLFIVPAAASIHGANDTFFQTDVWAVSTSPHTTAWTYSFRCQSGATCDAGPGAPTLLPQSGSRFQDFLSLINRKEQAGALELTTDFALGPVAFMSRTYSPALPAPTTGSQIPALRDTEARTDSVLIGLGASPNPAIGFRTNVGLYVPGASSGSATITLFDQNGSPVGAPYTVPATSRRPTQINNVFQVAGASSANGPAYYAVVSSTVPAISYATVIDNQSADSVIVTGVAR